MEPLKIKEYPDKILRKNCADVKEITDIEKNLFEKMIFTMNHFCGIGLAAPQIGIGRKLIVAEVEKTIIKLADPRIVAIKGIDKMIEGCLSVPDLTVEVERPYEVIVKGLNEAGRTVEIEAKGLLARVLQHEIDHLKGKLIIDYNNCIEGADENIRD